MVDPALLGVVVAAAVPLAGFLYRLDRRAGKAVRLLTGEEEVDGDGVIPRLNEVEDRADVHEQALREQDALPIADGGRDVEEGE